ncbi:MAG: hypothetical protein A2381_00630 [Bdellovibrionales bacterium RIFOXYB1_FULL_37_110]|nr:MAG: hypothetical protein A2417_01485 [Bdellovibrionales bacterium RIFOXYC1_FULL_37_79]OFZ58725.1 MAG: hypothetical protein A2381_00630 [Bdellovibrionales bacterium RIFOXYB1_FULL_37_110]OFZ64724.1 MAG: hypothetical protein A2577_06630 [Bdellovibrionales bacterium RIFOXYD1_FULL_36_51]
MGQIGYYYGATICNEKIAFVSDNDLWLTDINGGVAHRLTSNQGTVTTPNFSPDGNHIAYVATDSGQSDMYLLSLFSGEWKRLTFLNIGFGRITGWKNNDVILFYSTHESMVRGPGYLYELNIKTSDVKKIEVGPANRISFGNDGLIVIGRNCKDSIYWKRYQGGTVGVLWVKANKEVKFKRILKDIRHNLTDPTFIKGRIFFISDHEGISNVYSVKPDGRSIKRHTHHDEYYVRGLSSDGENIVYSSGPDIYYHDLAKGESIKIEITISTSGIEKNPRYVLVNDFLEDYSINYDGSELAFSSRGRLFKMPTWVGAPFVLGRTDEVRYKLPTWLHDGKGLVCSVTNDVGVDELNYVKAEDRSIKRIASKIDFGKIMEIASSPEDNWVAITNNRNELWLVHATRNITLRVDKNDTGRMNNPSWSPDGNWLAYTFFEIQSGKVRIWVYNLKSKKKQILLEPVRYDYDPVFSPDGKYLYFIGIREFVPNYNETHFDLGFPFASRLYVVSLTKEAENPFYKNLIMIAEDEEDGGKNKNNKKKKGEKDELIVKIDFDGIDNRVYAFPVDHGGYKKIAAVDGKIFYLKKRIAPIINQEWRSNESNMSLYQFSFDEMKEELFHKNVEGFEISFNYKKMLLDSEKRLRVISVDSKPKPDTEGYNKKEGWVDLERAKLRIDPALEWKQMYSEAWLLQKEHFWTKDMSKIEWDDIYHKYRPFLERVHTRKEMSDLLWEMQGELGTSHCYEFFGDYYKKPPFNPVAKLGVGLKWIAKEKTFEIVTIHKGDSWLKDGDSPLNGMGTALKPRDKILEVDGIGFKTSNCIHRLLENKAGSSVNLLIKKNQKKNAQYIHVPTLMGEEKLRYREWVEKNKQYVHVKSKGKLGYVHIPDMGARGYAEFYRHYITECGFDGLIIDVRFNGGGHVSCHLLKILAQKVLGFDQSRWSGVEAYPHNVVNGPMVAITNEQAGSDGDIFSHSFKMMRLGKLIGKRTWGGVIGIDGKYMLKDGTITTQPEYSFWFKDVKWGVENYGTDPDIEVEITPEDYRTGLDPQLDRAIEECLKDLKKNPPLKPDLTKDRPNLRALKLK